jgi:hypothetical protein
MIVPVQPQSRAVVMARAARLATPRAEAAFPPRSLVAAWQHGLHTNAIPQGCFSSGAHQVP